MDPEGDSECARHCSNKGSEGDELGGGDVAWPALRERDKEEPVSPAVPAGRGFLFLSSLF